MSPGDFGDAVRAAVEELTVVPGLSTLACEPVDAATFVVTADSTPLRAVVRYWADVRDIEAELDASGRVGPGETRMSRLVASGTGRPLAGTPFLTVCCDDDLWRAYHLGTPLDWVAGPVSLASAVTDALRQAIMIRFADLGWRGAECLDLTGEADEPPADEPMP